MISITYFDKMLSIKSDNVYFSLIEGMYVKDTHGIGIQVVNEAHKEETQKVCLQIHDILRKNSHLFQNG